MKESGKETIVIVHGTLAAPKSGTRRSYQPFDEARRATASLRSSMQRCRSAALQPGAGRTASRTVRFSNAPARTLGSRARAPRRPWGIISLVFRLVAHSHGGNVVLEALPQIMVALGSNELLG